MGIVAITLLVAVEIAYRPRLPVTYTVLPSGVTATLLAVAGSGITVSDGVVCDEFCQAAADVWAAGDVARWLHPGLGQHILGHVGIVLQDQVVGGLGIAVQIVLPADRAGLDERLHRRRASAEVLRLPSREDELPASMKLSR